jgi:hypothetical protein
MMSTRRLALSLLCSASLAAALLTASPAVASQPAASPRADACGAAPGDVEGTFAGTFEDVAADQLSVTFTAPRSVTTQWTVKGDHDALWTGSGKGEYEIGDTGPQWTNSDIVGGPVDGVDTENYRSVRVECANGGSQVTTISGIADSGAAQIPFTINRQ